MMMLVFLVIRPWAGRYQRFGGTYCFHLQGWSSSAWKQSITTMSPLNTEILCASEKFGN
jgi:hypothetical protein